jgi:integrase
VPLSTTVDFFEKHGATVKEHKTVPEIIAELLDGLTKDKKTDYHIRDTKLRLDRFAKTFPGQIMAISTKDINAWLRGMRSLKRNEVGGEISGRTRNNMRGAVVQLFNFAKENNYLPNDLATAADPAKRAKEFGGENDVFTPGELETLVTKAPEWLIPSLVLKSFAGVRTEELIKMKWRHVHFDKNTINLTKDVTKLTQRRVIKLQPNLRAWLEPFRQQPEDRICESWTTPGSASQSWGKLATTLGIKCSKNKFRNSFISYRVAHTKNIAEVALESGNSPTVIRRDYFELVSEEDALKWFAIFPKSQNRPV